MVHKRWRATPKLRQQNWSRRGLPDRLPQRQTSPGSPNRPPPSVHKAASIYSEEDAPFLRVRLKPEGRDRAHMRKENDRLYVVCKQRGGARVGRRSDRLCMVLATPQPCCPRGGGERPGATGGFRTAQPRYTVPIAREGFHGLGGCRAGLGLNLGLLPEKCPATVSTIPTAFWHGQDKLVHPLLDHPTLGKCLATGRNHSLF